MITPNPIKRLYVCALIFTLFACKNEVKQSIDLSGQWSFKMDALDLGEDEKMVQS